MTNNKLYHRQCYRHHERTSSMIVDDVGLPPADMVSDSDKAASVFVSTSSTLKYSHTPSLSFASKTDLTSCETSSSVQAPTTVSCSASCETSAVVTGEQASVKPMTEQQQVRHQRVAVNKASLESVNQVIGATDNISAQEPSVSAQQQTDSINVVVTQSTEMSTNSIQSVEVGVPSEELVRRLPCSVGDSLSQMKPTGTDASEQLQNKVDSKTSKKAEPRKPAETSRVPTSVSESSSSSLLAVAAAEGVVGSATKDQVISTPTPVSRASCQKQAPVNAAVITLQPVSHFPTVDVCCAVSPSSKTLQPEVPLPCTTVSALSHDVSDASPAAACDVVTPLSSCKSVNHAVKDSHPVVPRRRAPLPPRPTPTEKQLTQLNSGQTTVSISRSQEPLELSQQTSSNHSLQSNTRDELQSSKETVGKQYEVQTTSAPIQGEPVPTPRHPQTSKFEAQSTDVEICEASLSTPESALFVKAAHDNAAVALKLPPVPKRRKNLPVVEPGKAADKGKPDAVVKHELHQADVSLADKSKAGNSFITDSCMSAAAGKEAGVQIQLAARQRSPEIGTSPRSGEVNNSPSISPALPVKYPRSKKRSAAPRPPILMSPKQQSLKPEVSSATMPEPANVSSSQVTHQKLEPPQRPSSPASASSQVTQPPQRPSSPASASSQVTHQKLDPPQRPSSPASISSQVTHQKPEPPQRPASPASAASSSQVTNNGAEKSPVVKYEQNLPVDSVQPVRRKITPGVKFTFEKDAFRPAMTSAAVDTSAAVQLKPSRPAPPRPDAVAITKRKVLQSACLLTTV